MLDYVLSLQAVGLNNTHITICQSLTERRYFLTPPKLSTTASWGVGEDQPSSIKPKTYLTFVNKLSYINICIQEYIGCHLIQDKHGQKNSELGVYPMAQYNCYMGKNIFTLKSYVRLRTA